MKFIFLIATVGTLLAFNYGKPEAPIQIGEKFGGGIVFYVDATGEHGLVAAPSDQKKLKWYNGNFVETKASGSAVGTGQANTFAIVKAQGNGEYAASACVQLDIGGFDDWYLPSKEELNLLRVQRHIVGGLTGTYYWSSTEHSSHYAWGQNFNNGFQDYGNKNSAPSIRAIRSF